MQTHVQVWAAAQYQWKSSSVWKHFMFFTVYYIFNNAPPPRPFGGTTRNSSLGLQVWNSFLTTFFFWTNRKA